MSRLALGVLLVCALVGAAARPAAPAPTAVTLLAAGDIASCASTGDEATAAILARQKGTVAVLGDAVYERGTAEEFTIHSDEWAPPGVQGSGHLPPYGPRVRRG